MKIANPYKCNGCTRPMGETSDGWYLGSVVQKKTVSFLKDVGFNDGVTFKDGAFIIVPWSDERADDDKVEHLCSIDCALKSAGKWLNAQSPDTHSVKQSFTLDAAEPSELHEITSRLVPR